MDVLDTNTHEFLEGFGQFWSAVAPLSVSEKRRAALELFTTPRSEMEPVARFQEEEIDGPRGSISLRLFKPEGRGPFPSMLFFHHGGFALGSLDECEPFCRMLANKTEAVVVAVDYGLAPENKFPKPLEDAFAALQWVQEHAQSIQVDREQIGVAGESAGGNLAAAVSLMAREKKALPPAFQALFYPIMTCELSPEPYKNSLDKHLITFENMHWFIDQYLSSEEERLDPLASPLKAASLARLPRALMITAGWDPLRFEAEAYAKRLQKEGVKAEYHCYEKVIHGFLGFPLYPTEVSRAMETIRKFVHSK